jgi:CelD/BcsL family acetyltransferase involved in cellulose biosynthesis
VDALTVEPVEIDSVRAEWAALARAADNVFATVEWNETWLADPPGDIRPLVHAAYAADGRLTAIVPLVVVRGRYVRKARFAGFGAGNELGPIAAPADRELAVDALRLTLARTRDDWDTFVGDSLPGEGWGERLGGKVVRREGSPVADGGWTSWDEYLATRSRTFRQELRRKERRLLEQGVTFRSVTAAAELAGALDALFELHRARWGADASPWFAGMEEFHRRFASLALERGWLRLRLLERDGSPEAVYQGFRFAGSEWSYQFGRNPSSASSIGLVMTAHAIRESFADGAETFRLGPGTQHYKLRFATGDTVLETVAIGRGLRGRAAVAAAVRRGG